MQTRFASIDQYASIEDVRLACPEAAKILYIDCGWMVFLTVEAIEAICCRSLYSERIPQSNPRWP